MESDPGLQPILTRAMPRVMAGEKALKHTHSSSTASSIDYLMRACAEVRVCAEAVLCSMRASACSCVRAACELARVETPSEWMQGGF